MMLLDPKEITLTTRKGEERTYIISLFPAIAGREILTRYPFSGAPRTGDYATNEAMMLKIMSHVGVPVKGRDMPLLLTTRALVDNHVPDWETLARLEKACIEYNTSFFEDGRVLNSSAALSAWTLPNLIEILTILLGNLSQAGERPSTT